MNDGQRSGLRGTLRTTAQSLRLDLRNIRENFDHNGIKGTSVEEAFRNLLQRHFPDSIGFTSGHIVDVYGEKSGQLDVILYDKPRTPMLFGDRDSTNHSVPAEGVIAVIEVKSRLTKQMLPELMESCRKVKSLRKEAYFASEVVTPQMRYGRQFIDLPIYYSVFAFESDNTYAGPLNDAQMNWPLEQRIDSLCYLDRGVGLNISMDWTNHHASFSPWPTPSSLLADTIDPERALLQWFAAFSTAVAQVKTRPIDLTHYLQDDLNMEANFPGGAAAQKFTEESITAIADGMGVRPEILHKFHRGEGIKLVEAVEVLKVNEDYIVESDDMSEDSRQMLQFAKVLARKGHPEDS